MPHLDFRSVPLGIQQPQISPARSLATLGRFQQVQNQGRQIQLLEEKVAHDQALAAQAQANQQEAIAISSGTGLNQLGQAASGAALPPIQGPLTEAQAQGQILQPQRPGLPEPPAAPGQTVAQIGGSQQQQRQNRIQKVDALVRLGTPEAFKQAELIQNAAKNRLELDKGKLENTLERLRIAGGMASGIVDEATHQEFLSHVSRTLPGLDTSILGEHFSPENTKRIRALGLTTEQQLEEDIRQEQLKIDRIDSQTKQIVAIAKAAEAAQKVPDVVKTLSVEARDALGAAKQLRPGFEPSEDAIVTAVKDGQQVRLARSRAQAEALFGLQAVPTNVSDPLIFSQDLIGVMADMKTHLKTGFVGFVKGPAGRLRLRVTGKEQSGGETEFRQAASLALGLWARAQSGAAIAATEWVNFREQIPQEGDSAPVLLKKLDFMTNFLKKHQKTLARVGSLTRGQLASFAKGETELFPAGAPAAPESLVDAIRRAREQ